MSTKRITIPKIISDGGVVCHYHEYRSRRKSLHPMCNHVSKDSTKIWREDDLSGASLCGMCDKMYKSRIRAIRKNHNAREKIYRDRNLEQRAEYRRQYYKECEEAIRLKRKMYYWRKRGYYWNFQDLGMFEEAEEILRRVQNADA